MEALNDVHACKTLHSPAITFDRMLSSGPFGDTELVRQSCASITRTLFEFCANDDPVISVLQTRLSHAAPAAMLAPQVRYAIRSSLDTGAVSLQAQGIPIEGWLAESPSPTCSSVDATVRVPVFFPSANPGAAAVLSAIYDKEVPPVNSPSKAALIDPPADVLDGIVGGLDLLARLMPETARSCFEHVSLAGIYCVDGKIRGPECNGIPYWGSVSTPAVAGAIFAFSAGLVDPWRAAEALFHESIHCKMFDLYCSPGLVQPEYDKATATAVVSEWNEMLSWRTNEWPLDQALGAFHVYVHLLSFFATAAKGDHPPEVAAHISKRLGAALKRSASLEVQMRPAVARHLTPEGLDFFEWLSSCRQAFRA